MDKTVRQVFISHIHEERNLALALQELIYAPLKESIGGTVNCFLSSDRFQFDAGEEWMARVKSELGKADIIILMLSPQSLTRHWISLEGGAAWVLDRIIIPVFYSGLTTTSIPRPYSDLNAIGLEDESYHLLRSIWKTLVPTPPQLPHDHSACRRLAEAIAQNTQRLAAWKGDARKERIRELLHFAIAEIADTAKVPVRDLGIHVWNLHSADGHQFLKRFVRGRLSHAPTSPMKNWSRGEGAVGFCWESEQNVIVDLTDPRYRASSEPEWSKLPPELRIGMLRDEFNQTTAPFKAIFAVPIKPDDAFMGCISLNVDKDVQAAATLIWNVAKDVLRRLAADVGQILRELDR